MDFLGGSEIAARAGMLGMENTVKQAEIQAQKAQNKDHTEYMKRLQEVSRDFESIFLSYMLKQMRKTVPEDALFGNSTAKDIFYEMYDESLSKELAKAGGIGLAAVMYKQFEAVENMKKPVPSPEISPNRI